MRPSGQTESESDLLLLFHSHHENDHQQIITITSVSDGDMLLSASVLFLTEEDAAEDVTLPSSSDVVVLDCYRSELDDCSEKEKAIVLPPEENVRISVDLTSRPKGNYLQHSQVEKNSEHRCGHIINMVVYNV